MKRATLITGGAVGTALVLAAGAVTVANAIALPVDSSRVLEDHGIDTATVSPSPTSTPSPTPRGSHGATPEPGDDHGHDGVVTVPPAGPTVIDRNGDPEAPDDNPGAHDQNGHEGGGDSGDDAGPGGDESGSGDQSGDGGDHASGGGHGSSPGAGDSGRGGSDDGPKHR